MSCGGAVDASGAPDHHSLHHLPPLTPAGVLLRHRFTVPLLVVSFVALAAAAAVDDGSVLLALDRSVTTALHDVRSEPLDLVVQTLSGLGGLTVVVALLVVLLLIVWHQCRALALTLLVATAARPLLEWVLKEAVDRARPDIAQLVPGNGPSFPSGHVMAAVAAWGLLPPVVALVTGRRSAWWWSVGLFGAAILLVAFSRVYLGVHWFSDVLGALLLGALYLLAVEWLLAWHHHRHPCHELRASVGGGRTATADARLPAREPAAQPAKPTPPGVAWQP